MRRDMPAITVSLVSYIMKHRNVRIVRGKMMMAVIN